MKHVLLREQWKRENALVAGDQIKFEFKNIGTFITL